jgi:hypothetical protein
MKDNITPLKLYAMSRFMRDRSHDLFEDIDVRFCLIMRDPFDRMETFLFWMTAMNTHANVIPARCRNSAYWDVRLYGEKP